MLLEKVGGSEWGNQNQSAGGAFDGKKIALKNGVKSKVQIMNIESNNTCYKGEKPEMTKYR